MEGFRTLHQPELSFLLREAYGNRAGELEDRYQEVGMLLQGKNGQLILKVRHFAILDPFLEHHSCEIGSEYSLGILLGEGFKTFRKPEHSYPPIIPVAFETDGHALLKIGEYGKILQFNAGPLNADLVDFKQPVRYDNTHRLNREIVTLHHINALNIIAGNDEVEAWFDSTGNTEELRHMDDALKARAFSETRI